MKVREEIEYLNRPITGMIMFRTGTQNHDDLMEILSALKWKILKSHADRIMVRAKRRELLEIKQTWMEDNDNNPRSHVLNRCISNIIISGQ